MKENNRLALVVVVGALAAMASPGVQAQPEATGAAAPPVAMAALHDEAGSLLLQADWSPRSERFTTPVTSLSGSGVSRGFTSRVIGASDPADSVGKVRLRAGHWLLLSGFVGLLGATRRRRAR